MTTESDPNVSGNVVPTTKPEGSGDKQVSVDVQAIVTAVKDALMPEFDKKLQSIKDRRISELEKGLTDVQRRLADDLQKRGIAPEAAEYLAARLPETAKAGEPKASDKVEGGNHKPTLTDAETVILKRAGIREDDPDYVAFTGRQFADADERLYEVSLLAAKKANPKQVSAAGAPAAAGASPELAVSYKSELATIPRGDIEAIFALKEKYRGMGLAL